MMSPKPAVISNGDQFPLICKTTEPKAREHVFFLLLPITLIAHDLWLPGRQLFWGTSFPSLCSIFWPQEVKKKGWWKD